MIALSLLFLCVLALWPIGEPLQPFLFALQWGFWIALRLIPLHLLVSTNRRTEIFSLRRAYRRQAERSRFRPVTIAEARARAEDLAGAAVSVVGPYRFRTCAEDWSWGDFQKNAMVFGLTESGKNVTVLNSLLDGLLSSANG